MPVSPVLFKNHFENIVSPFGWSGTAISAGCSVVAEAVRPHHGAYNLKAYVPAAAAEQFAIVYYGSLANAYQHLFIRAMNCSWDTNPANNSMHPFMGFWQDPTSNNMARAGVFNSGGNIRWGIRYRSLAAFSNASGTSTPTVNTLYCVEFEIMRSTVGNTDGLVRLYVNGILEIEVLNLDNDDRNLNYVEFGADSFISSPPSNWNFRGDCIEISTMYIGCERALAHLRGLGGDKRLKTQLISTKRSGTRMGLH